jgi:hypothetical protein
MVKRRAAARLLLHAPIKLLPAQPGGGSASFQGSEVERFPINKDRVGSFANQSTV